MKDTTAELVSALATLEAGYLPFRDGGAKWKGDVDALMEVVEGRDLALQRGEAAIARIRELWTAWEGAGPTASERAKVFEARNRIVELGLGVAKSDTSLQSKIRRRMEDLRREAADSGRRQSATKAYMSRKVGL